MNGTTLTDLGWNATEDHIPVPLEHKEREETNLVLVNNGGEQQATIYTGFGEWVTSDTLVPVEN